MTSPDSDRTAVPTSLAIFHPDVAAADAPVAERVATLNRTHAMAGMREVGGAVVRAIEERRRRLVASRVLRSRPRV